MPDLKKMLTLEALSEALPSWLKRSTKPEYNADEIDSTLTTNQFVTASDKENWNAKGTYSKPSGGIPKSDLSSIVQTSLEKADSALQSETDPTVPSWAKQSSKPSYTQDEVPDGSTYKRVTQTEKNAWSGKQNALSTTQMQAVNSGITSEKVTQISTNQTNILLVEKSNPMCNELHYNVEDLKKINSSDYSWSNNVASLSGIKFTINEDNSISWVATNNAKTVWFILYDSSEMPAIASGEYVLHGCPSGGGISTYELEAVVGGSDKKEYGDSTSFTVSNNLTIVAIGIRVGSSSGTFYPVLINKSLYDAGITDYVVPTLPNYDLTRLESEDRAALIECVDEGAKNLFDHDTVTTAGSSYVINTYINPLPADSYVFSYTSNQEEAGNLQLVVRNGDAVLADPTIVSKSGRNIIPFTISSTASRIELYTVMAGTYSDFMLCTKAKYDVSPNYVSYALPNTDLTQLEAEDRAALAEVVDSGAKNKFDLSVKEAAKTTNITVTKTANSITVTSDTSANEAYVSYPIYIDKAGKYVITATFSNVNLERSSAILRFSNTATGGLLYTLTITGNGTLSGEFDISTAGTYWLLFAPNWSSATAVNTYTASDIMVCLKAAYDVSQAYVPYRKNLDQLEATKAPALSTITMDSGSLDDITTNSFIACSWEVAGKPISTMGFVRTSVFDANSALQEFYSFSADETQSGLVYVRDKQAGVWRSWKLLTNNT